LVQCLQAGEPAQLLDRSQRVPPDFAVIIVADHLGQQKIIELTGTERALIRLLRTSDVPPDVVAEAIRGVMERRMGR